MNHCVAGARKLHAEVGAVARHDHHDAAVLDPARGVQRRLEAAIERLRKKWSLWLMNSSTSAAAAGSVAGRHDRRRDGPVEERGGGAVAVVDLVAHVQRLGDEVLQVDRAQLRDGLLQDRVEGVLHPVAAAG